MLRPAALKLHEEVLLLSVQARGRMEPVLYRYPIAAALIAELSLEGRIQFDETGKKPFIELVDPAPHEDPVMNECIVRLRDAKRRAQISTWLTRFAGMKNLVPNVAKRLCRMGILRTAEEKVLLLFTRKLYPEVDPKPERELIERLRAAIFKDGTSVDSRTAVLVALANSAELLPRIFDKKDLKRRKARIEALASGDLLGEATKQAIAAIRMVMMTAAIVPIITAS
jgi:Golgi phosphoprotein 3